MKRLLVLLVILVALNGSLYPQSTWTLQPTGYTLNTNIQDAYFFNSQTGLICGGGGVLARTTNSGLNWTKILNNQYNLYYRFSFINNNTGWVSGRNYSNFELIRKTTNGGITWDSLVFEASGIMYDMIFLDINTGYVAGIYMKKTTNGGLNWFVIDPTSPYQYHHINFINTSTGWITKSYNDQYSNVYVAKLQKTTNGGQNWIIQINDSSTTNNQIESIKFFNANTGFISTADSGILKTTNGGNSWIYTNSGGGGKIFFLNENTGWLARGNLISRTTNSGLNWQTEIITPVLTFFSGLYFINEFTGWIGGQQSSSAILYKTTNGGITTSVNQTSTEIPSKYSLSQNYPNPFNQSTMFNVQCAMQRHVTLKVYDITGKEVAVLINKIMQPGTYQVRFDAGNLTSGVYFYTITAGDYTETKKMLMIK